MTDTAPLPLQRGSCHCGAVRFEAEGAIESGMACNCSMCQRKGSLLWFLPRERVRVLAGEDGMGRYLFHRHAIAHRFCTVCGIHPFAEGRKPDGTPMTAVNLRCLEDIDLDAIPVQHVNGRAF